MATWVLTKRRAKFPMRKATKMLKYSPSEPRDDKVAKEAAVFAKRYVESEHPRDSQGEWRKLGVVPEGTKRAQWDSDKGETKVRFPSYLAYLGRPMARDGSEMTERIVGFKYDDELDVKPGAGAAPSMFVGGRQIQASPGFVEAFDAEHLPGIQRWADDNGVPLKDVLAKMQDTAHDYVADSRVCVRVGVSVLPSVLREGLKNQFATGTSGGSYKPGLRKDAESELFGLPKTGVRGKERPLYGFVGASDGGNGHGVGQYGDVVLVLKRKVAERTMMTQSDSLDRRLVPEPMSAPTWRQVAYPRDNSGYNAMNLRPDVAGYELEPLPLKDRVPFSATAGSYQYGLGQLIPEMALDWMNPSEANPERASGGYVEAQIFGGVQAEDIEEVVFSAPGRDRDPRRRLAAESTALLDELGIPWSATTDTSRTWVPPR